MGATELNLTSKSSANCSQIFNIACIALTECDSNMMSSAYAMHSPYLGHSVLFFIRRYTETVPTAKLTLVNKYGHNKFIFNEYS